jgi:RNA recognition motif-containing protein
MWVKSTYSQFCQLLFFIVNFMNLFVANLDFNMDDNELRSVFEPYGDVQSAKVILHRDTGRSRGFGFVEMEDDSAREAIDALNEQEVNGRVLVIKEAEERRERSSGGSGGGGFRPRSNGGGGRNGGNGGGNDRYDRY